MKLLTVQLPDSHNLVHFGDKHGGSSLSSKKGWRILTEVMHSKYDGCSNNYGISMGDLIEAIMIDDKRYSEEKLTEKRPLQQMRDTESDLKPIAKKLLTMLDGNHERKLWRFGNLMQDMADTLGVPYGTYSCKVTIQDKKGNLMYKDYVTHGLRSISSTADDPKRRQTNMELILKRHLKFKAGDCAVMVKGHTHKLLVCKPESELYLVDDGEHIKQQYTGWGQTEQFIHPDSRWYGNSGSFLKLYGDDVSGYAEIAEYDPVELGFLILRCRDKKIVGLDPYFIKI